jgi:hypothetical protein
MSLLTQASLVLTPTSYKANKLYSVVPSSGSGDLTTTRATTATRINSSGLVENVTTGIPRLDYTNGVANILLEPQRTNLLLNSVWAGGGTTPTSFTKSFLGTTTPITSVKNPNVTAYNFNGTSIRGYFYQTQPFTINNVYSLSVYIENVTITQAIIDIIAIINATGTSVYYKNNVAISSSTNIESGNTYTIVFTATATTTISEVRFGLGVNGGTPTGDFTLSMPQLELGSYATSYIPTVASTVTRNADLASVSGVSSLIGQTEGVMFIESAALANDLTDRIISISDGTTSNRIILYYSTSSNNIAAAMVSAGTVVIPGISYNVTDETQFAKIAVRYSNTLGVSLWINGVNRASSIVTTLPISMNRFSFDRGTSGSNTFYGKVKSTQLYKTYLTDAEMASLTTL